MMTHFITIDELEREISYLREQNQKLIKELAQVVEENSDLREERATERQRLREILERGEREKCQNRSDWRGQHGDEDDQLCLN
jgi:regulator of replication initiation timing